MAYNYYFALGATDRINVIYIWDVNARSQAERDFFVHFPGRNLSAGLPDNLPPSLLACLPFFLGGQLAYG